jgi:hypothetical protein
VQAEAAGRAAAWAARALGRCAILRLCRVRIAGMGMDLDMGTGAGEAKQE